MKNIFIVFFMLIGLMISNLPVVKIYAEEENKVKVISQGCYIYIEPNYNSEKIEQLIYGDILVLKSKEIIKQGNFGYFNVATDEGIEGFVLQNCVIDNSLKSLEKKLDPNAKILNNNVFVYITEEVKEENKIKINGEVVQLKQYEEIKIINEYNKSKELQEILFERNGVIYNGYVKTSDLLVEGFNPVIILIIFIFLLIISIILSIVLTTRKKRKKKNKNGNNSINI